MNEVTSHDPSQFSHSALSLYRDCGLKYKYERLIRLVPRGRGVNHDLRYGSAGHEALAALYSGASLKDVGNAFKDAYPLNEYPDPLPTFSQGKSQSNFLAALWAYIKTQWQEDQANWEVLEVEQPQASTGLGEYDHMLVLDLIVRDRRDGQVWGVDHKLTGKYIKDIWNKYEHHSQVLMYVDQIRRRFGNCGGFIVNAFSLKHRSRAYTPRTGPEKGIQLPAGDWYSFGRMAYCPSRDLLNIEAANVRATVDHLRHDIEQDSFTYNTGMCFAGTQWECPYYTLCRAGYTWPRDQYAIEEYYRHICHRQISGEQRCQMDADHDGECSEYPSPESTPTNIIVMPQDDPYYMNLIED